MANIVPFKSMLSPFGRLPSIWDDDDFQMLTSSFSNVNGVDVFETENEYVVKANVAGVKADDIDVTFEDGMLWIQAKASEEEKDKEHKYYSKASWNYSYKVSVPGMVDYNQEPDVTLEDGVLVAKFAKSEASKPKKLTVKSSNNK